MPKAFLCKRMLNLLSVYFILDTCIVIGYLITKYYSPVFVNTLVGYCIYIYKKKHFFCNLRMSSTVNKLSFLKCDSVREIESLKVIFESYL